MSQISVIIEFTGAAESDVSLREVFCAHGSQAYPPEQVEFLIVTAEESPELHALIAATFGAMRSSVRVIAIASGSTDYYPAKMQGSKLARGRVIAFADSDVVVPPNWLRNIHQAVLDDGHPIVLGPTWFKSGCILRRTLELADFGAVNADNQRWSTGITNNVALARSLFDRLRLDPKFNRFGGTSSMASQLRKLGVPILLEPKLRAKHGFSWKVWLYEKRLRRYAHNAYMKRHDPNATLRRPTGVPEKPLTWLPAWWCFARRYQTWPGRCRQTLRLNRMQRAVHRVLLAFLSAYELALILYVGIVPGALQRVARKNLWWQDEVPLTQPIQSAA